MADNIPSGNEYRAGRSDSTSSASSTGSNSGSAPPPIRSSTRLFETLKAQKRKDDPQSRARRQSMSEQKPAPGFLGRMWNTWVYGTDKNPNTDNKQ